MNPLHVPLANLPAPVPMWTPGIVRSGGGSPHFAPVALVPRLLSAATRHHYFVDLSPPPIDANGHPTRIDAMPILVSMLARAMGHPEGQYTFMPSTTPGAWNLRTFIDGPVRRMSSTFRPDGVGALASIEPRATNAPRLALAALFAARVWETA